MRSDCSLAWANSWTLERSLRADEADKPEGSGQGAWDLLAQFVPGSPLLGQALFEPVGLEPIEARAKPSIRSWPSWTLRMSWLSRLLVPVLLWWLAQPPAPFRRIMRPLARDSQKQKAALVPAEQWMPVGSLWSATTTRHSARVSYRAPAGSLLREP